MLTSLLLFLSSQLDKLTITSPVVEGLCVASQYRKDKFDHMWLSKKTGSTVKKLVKLPATRYDRNVSELIFVNGNNVVVLANLGDTLRFPFFFRNESSVWEVLPQRKDMNYPSGENVVKFGSYLVVISLGMVSGELGQSSLWVFGPNGLKPGDIKFYGDELKRTSSNSFQIRQVIGTGYERKEVWREFKWPFNMKNGAWILTEIK